MNTSGPTTGHKECRILCFIRTVSACFIGTTFIAAPNRRHKQSARSTLAVSHDYAQARRSLREMNGLMLAGSRDVHAAHEAMCTRYPAECDQLAFDTAAALLIGASASIGLVHAGSAATAVTNVAIGVAALAAGAMDAVTTALAATSAGVATATRQLWISRKLLLCGYGYGVLGTKAAAARKQRLAETAARQDRELRAAAEARVAWVMAKVTREEEGVGKGRQSQAKAAAAREQYLAETAPRQDREHRAAAEARAARVTAKREEVARAEAREESERAAKAAAGREQRLTEAAARRQEAAARRQAREHRAAAEARAARVTAKHEEVARAEAHEESEKATMMPLVLLQEVGRAFSLG